MHSNFEIQLDKNTNFSLKGSGGLLIVGRSGSGKTNTTTYIMLKAISQCDCGLYIVDAKRADMYGLHSFLNNGEKIVASNTNQIALNITDYNSCSLGYPISQRSMNEMLKKICEKVGVENGNLGVSMYTCRHTCATKLGNTPGMSYPWAASRLGHSVKTFMRTYVHVDEDRNEEMLKLIM